jgi:hypothetical protein
VCDECRCRDTIAPALDALDPHSLCAHRDCEGARALAHRDYPSAESLALSGAGLGTRGGRAHALSGQCEGGEDLEVIEEEARAERR